MPWYDGPDAARAPRVDRARRRPQPRGPPLPGAVGDPPDVRRAPRLPRLRRARSPAASGGPATRSSCCRRAAARRVAAVETFEGPLEAAIAPQSVTIRLEDDVDVGRGDMLADPERAADRRARAHRRALLDERAAARAAARGSPSSTRPASVARRRRGARLGRRHAHARGPSRRPARLELNDLGVVRLRLAEPLAVDPYERNRATGAFILIDEATNDTVGAGHGARRVVSAEPRSPRADPYRDLDVIDSRAPRFNQAVIGAALGRSRSPPAGGGSSRCSRCSSPSA